MAAVGRKRTIPPGVGPTGARDPCRTGRPYAARYGIAGMPGLSGIRWTRRAATRATCVRGHLPRASPSTLHRSRIHHIQGIHPGSARKLLRQKRRQRTTSTHSLYFFSKRVDRVDVVDGTSNQAGSRASRVHPGKRNIQANRHYGGALPPFPCDSCVLFHPGIPVGVDVHGPADARTWIAEPMFGTSRSSSSPLRWLRPFASLPSLSRGEEGGAAPTGLASHPRRDWLEKPSTRLRPQQHHPRLWVA
jgi:hypothetical protein